MSMTSICLTVCNVRGLWSILQQKVEIGTWQNRLMSWLLRAEDDPDHTHTTILWLYGFCPGQPGSWYQKKHSPTHIIVFHILLRKTSGLWKMKEFGTFGGINQWFTSCYFSICELLVISWQESLQHGCCMPLLSVAVDNCISVARITNVKLGVVPGQQTDTRQLWVSTDHSWRSESLRIGSPTVLCCRRYNMLLHLLIFVIRVSSVLMHMYVRVTSWHVVGLDYSIAFDWPWPIACCWHGWCCHVGSGSGPTQNCKVVRKKWGKMEEIMESYDQILAWPPAVSVNGGRFHWKVREISGNVILFMEWSTGHHGMCVDVWMFAILPLHTLPPAPQRLFTRCTWVS